MSTESKEKTPEHAEKEVAPSGDAQGACAEDGEDATEFKAALDELCKRIPSLAADKRPRTLGEILQAVITYMKFLETNCKVDLSQERSAEGEQSVE